MKNNYLYLVISFLFLFTSGTMRANEEVTNEIEVIARIQSQGGGVQIIRSQEHDVIPSLLQDDKLKDKINSLRPGDEAIIRGRITYRASTVESQTSYHPIFLITSIQPISLKRIGIEKSEQLKDENQIYSKIEDYHHKYVSFPVTTEVASAVTMTTTALLMSSLSASAAQPGTITQINNGLILFAGAMATGVFIFEQITGKGKK